MEVNIDGVVYKGEPEGNGACRGCIAEHNALLCEAITGKTDCAVDYHKGLVWKIKEVKELVKPKEKETTMQKKEIDKSKKYKTVKGSDVELVYENYRYGEEYLWVVSPKDSPKFPIATNKYGESIMPEDFNLVEVNTLEELSKMPVDTLVKATSKNAGISSLRYMSHVSPDNEGVILFKEGRTSRTQEGTCLYYSDYYTFEIIE